MSLHGNGEDTDRDFSDLKMSYHTVRPNRWTFQSTKIRKWVESRLSGRVLNACAGKTRLNHDHRIVRNDINEERDADTHYDISQISEYFEPESFDTVVYDPPFSDFQSDTKYEGEKVGSESLAKREIDAILSPGGTVIQFGYTTTCMPNSLDYERLEVGVWNTLGRSNDYLSTIDQKDGENDSGRRWF